MSHQVIVKMIQISKYEWNIVSDKGYLLQNHIYFASMDKAEEYVKAFISSYNGWSWQMMPLKSEEDL